MRPKLSFNSPMDKKAFTSALSPIGYNLYSEEGEYLKFFFHIKDLKKYCIEMKLSPLDVKITRVLSDKRILKESKMNLNDYAFCSTIYEVCSIFEIEREAWSWEEDPFIESVKKKTKKVKIFIFNRLICWTAAIFSIFR